jgi:catechol 2,3-dioxygenase-like lactoylglutathione lyase family enzyme
VIKGLEHVGLSVSDLDRSIAFYRDILGLEVIRILEPLPEFPLGRVVGMPDCKARIAHLQSEKGMLELFEYQVPKGKPIPKDHKQADNGFIHAGFTSSDAREDYRRMREAGVKFLSEPVEFRPGVWIFYFYGPDGEVCEVRQT